MNNDWLLFVFSQLAVAGGIYAGIRADLREALTRIALLEKRMDKLD